MPNTTKYALAYPGLTDAPNVPQHIQSLATTVETALSAHAPALATTATTGVTFATGWVAGSEGVRLTRTFLGGTAKTAIVQIQVNVDRASGAATITAGTDGNVADVDLFTVPDPYRPQNTQQVSIQVVTSAPATGRIHNGGTCTLQELASGGSITAGRSLRVAVTFMQVGVTS